jgi:hypothetical protein
MENKTNQKVEPRKTAEQVREELALILFPKQPSPLKKDGSLKSTKELRKERRKVSE